MKQATVAILLAIILIAGTYFYWRGMAPAAPVASAVELASAMGGDTTGYARALRPRAFQFPADHGPHDDFKLEWWYFTGNLQAVDGRRYGYQLTIFRNAMAPAAPDRTSAWGSRQLYMGHFAITDVSGGAFYDTERFSRGALDLAGASAVPLRIWLEDWEIRETGRGSFHDLPELQLQAAGGRAALQLTVRSQKPIVLQGDSGLSQKGRGAGNASYYYSATRLASEGQIIIDGQSTAVQGTSWLDREWSTSALDSNQVGWDWFSLQLSDGSELMYYQLRQHDGSVGPLSKGTLVAATGTAERLAHDDVQLTVTDHWRSPRGGSYPAAWQLALPAHNLRLTITPQHDDQELQAAVRYWEGSVKISGERNGRPLDGFGYVELTGYARTHQP